MQFQRICVFIVALALSVLTACQSYAEGQVNEPLSTPSEIWNNSPLGREFAEKKLQLGSPVFVRVYKQTSEMQLWVSQGSRYVLFKTYGICRWSGGLGPKFYEGDRQSPEGLYHITGADLIVNPRWHRAMNINYPNSFDLVHGRTGSSILIHGKCGSVGCFAIQDANVEEVYTAVRAALHNGQERVPVLVLPFKFATAAPEIKDTLAMNDFWIDLRRADLLFDRDRLPAAAWLCDGRYYFSDRRGDHRGHAVHLPGCKPLDKPLSSEEVAALANQLRFASAPEEETRQVVENDARTCNAKNAKCRMLRVALKSDTTCPKKYGRCRTTRAAITKSVECPLKYPRCRRFVGPDPRPRSAHLIKARHLAGR